MHFTNEEIKETYEIHLGSGAPIEKAQVFELLKTAFGFEPMPEEMGLFVTHLNLEEDGDITWNQISDGMDQIREMLKGVGKNASEFNSYQDLRDERFKHTRLRKDPMDKYKAHAICHRSLVFIHGIFSKSGLRDERF